MLGGVIVVLIVVWLVRVMFFYLLGVFVGGFIILINVWILFKVWFISDLGEIFFYIVIFIFWIVVIIFVSKKNQKNN